MSWSCHIAGCKNSIRHIENRFSPYFLFLFNAVWALTSGSFRIISDMLVLCVLILCLSFVSILNCIRYRCFFLLSTMCWWIKIITIAFICCRHLHEVHKPDDKNAAQVRLQMQLVDQLEAQVSLSDTVVVSSHAVVVSATLSLCLLLVVVV